ncbi:hypothetical protein BU23DRAFT_6462 [Bimuria novae-zelandiae CBS 107.79]|uniref:Uncharacterized protein n=1 Tax=Bimuria novae-zelandiae CBS 107.79 TaxID=1447943 RepID=A0A6A5VUA8_9PLEO|nr:hypothetical protein BU23DRAFT_6462 [Bimuria novae-zelandiae CBS 107.79]
MAKLQDRTSRGLLYKDQPTIRGKRPLKVEESTCTHKIALKAKSENLWVPVKLSDFSNLLTGIFQNNSCHNTRLNTSRHGPFSTLSLHQTGATQLQPTCPTLTNLAFSPGDYVAELAGNMHQNRDLYQVCIFRGALFYLISIATAYLLYSTSLTERYSDCQLPPPPTDLWNGHRDFATLGAEFQQSVPAACPQHRMSDAVPPGSSAEMPVINQSILKLQYCIDW